MSMPPSPEGFGIRTDCCRHTVWCCNPPTASAVAGPSTSSGDGSATACLSCGRRQATPTQGGSDWFFKQARVFPATFSVAAEQSEAALGTWGNASLATSLEAESLRMSTKKPMFKLYQGGNAVRNDAPLTESKF